MAHGCPWALLIFMFQHQIRDQTGIVNLSAYSFNSFLICMCSMKSFHLQSVIMRICDILMCIPGMLLAVCISSLLGIGEVNTAIAIAVSGVAPAIRMIRATVLQIRSQEFVEAAKATGSSQLKIIFHEILPNILSPLIVDSTMRIGGNILQISGLSFIGLGVQSPTAEWGSIMSDGQEFITTFWPMITFPGIAILLTVFAFNVMGDGLRDALDPRLKQ